MSNVCGEYSETVLDVSGREGGGETAKRDEREIYTQCGEQHGGTLSQSGQVRSGQSV